jgi:hypothetical protein
LGQPVAQIGKIQGCRHQHEGQVGSQDWGGFPQKCKGEIGILAPLMKFIKENARHSFK